MAATQPTVVITGIAGNLGLRLLSYLSEFRVVGVDFREPRTDLPVQFEKLDLGDEASCRDLYTLVREVRAAAVIHLAFILDPVRTGITDVDRMWHINVAGTGRVMEAVTEANRDEALVQKFVFPSSVAVYGPNPSGAVTEDAPLAAHTLPYAMHKMECDKVVQQRATALRGCSVYLLRPHIMTGPTMDNYMVGAFRGTPNGKGKRAARMREQGKRLPCMLPYGQRYLDNRLQFVHVDDVARLIAHIVRKTQPEAQRLSVLNVAGRGDPLSFGRCIAMAQARLVRVPGKIAMRMVLNYLWKFGISAIPPEALPYMTNEYIMSTDRLKKFLAGQYETVIQYSVEEAFAACFEPVEAAARKTA